MESINRDLSQFIGRAVQSPFFKMLLDGDYDYDDLIDEVGFFAGFSNRVAKAQSIDNISKADKKFQAICVKSSEIAIEKHIIDSSRWEEILDDLCELGLIEPQITFT